MFYADTVGLKSIRDRISTFRAEQGEELWPQATLLDELADADGRFATWKGL